MAHNWIPTHCMGTVHYCCHLQREREREREREMQAEADHLNQLAQLLPACVRGEKWLVCSLSRATHTPQVSQKSNFIQTPLVMFENQCISLQQCCRSRACRSAIFTMFASFLLLYYLLYFSVCPLWY